MKKQRWILKFLALLIPVTLITGCTSSGNAGHISQTPQAVTTMPAATNTQTPTLQPPTPTATVLPPTATLLPTNSPTPLSASDLIASLTALPTSSPTLPPTGTPTATKSSTIVPGAGLPGAVENAVRIFFIQPSTGGSICGDSLVSIATSIPRTGDIAPDVKAALNQLFSYKSKYVGNLYNPVHNANLKVSRVAYNSGLITVHLTGTVQNTKDKCENTRLKSQIWATVKQFRAITSTNIYLNNVPFGDFISND